MQGELAQVQWVSLHMQGASFPLHPLPPCPNPMPDAYKINAPKNLPKHKNNHAALTLDTFNLGLSSR